MSQRGTEVKIRQIYISPGHNYFGRHGQASGQNANLEVSEAECVAGRGIKGDRFFDFKENYKGQITFFSAEVFNEVCQRTGAFGKSPGVARRNVVTSGVDLNSLVGKQFEIQGVIFEGIGECQPCHWMNEAIAPGAEELLLGRGGLRARILTDGWLRIAAMPGAGDRIRFALPPAGTNVKMPCMEPQRSDITTEDHILILVDSFYNKVNADPLLSPIFNDVAKVEWQKHLPLLVQFWSTLLFRTDTYRGQPWPKHALLPVTAEHFERWVSLFKATVDEHFSGAKAMEAKNFAASIADTFQNRMQLAR